jgi:hypothetical protein
MKKNTLVTQSRERLFFLWGPPKSVLLLTSMNDPDDSISFLGLPAEIHHEIVRWVFYASCSSVASLCAAHTILRDAVLSARVEVRLAPHKTTHADVLSVARVAHAVGARCGADIPTGLALAVMYGYVVASIEDVTCWPARRFTILACGATRISRTCHPNRLIDRIGLAPFSSVSPDALLTWIVSNHRDIERLCAPPLFPVLADPDGDIDPWCLPDKMGKCKRHGDIKAVYPDVLCEWESSRAAATSDLLFGATSAGLSMIVSLPESTTQMCGGYVCTCRWRGSACAVCASESRIADAMRDPSALERIFSEINTRVRANLPLDVAACMHACSRLDLDFTDLFDITNVSLTGHQGSALFFGVVTPRFDVGSFLDSTKRMRR